MSFDPSASRSGAWRSRRSHLTSWLARDELFAKSDHTPRRGWYAVDRCLIARTITDDERPLPSIE